jgi:acyl-coenzyme A thioesterase PaaI-like protein
VTGHSALESFAPTLDLQALCPFSPAMGPANPLAPDIEISVDDDNTVHGLVTLGEAYNGPPFDHAHGGVVALLYDDLVGMATMLGAGGGMTANLSIDYRRPTPLFKPLEITAWFDHTEGRKLYSQGTMPCEGELLSEAHGLFIRPDSFPVGTPTPGPTDPPHPNSSQLCPVSGSKCDNFADGDPPHPNSSQSCPVSGRKCDNFADGDGWGEAQLAPVRNCWYAGLSASLPKGYPRVSRNVWNAARSSAGTSNPASTRPTSAPLFR